MIWRSLLTNLYAFIVTPVLSVVCLLAALLGDQRGIIWWKVAVAWARGLLKIGGVTKVIVDGREKLKKIESAIFMSNHESQLDPLLMTYLSEKSPIRFLAKHSLAYFPLFGQALWATGQILINRKKGSKAIKAIERAIEGIKNKDKYFFVFPEGGRSRNGELLPFKRGGFLMAVKTGLPIVPVAIAGTSEILPPGFLFRKKGPIVIVAGDSLSTRPYDIKSLDELIGRVRGQVAQLQKKARKMKEKLASLKI